MQKLAADAKKALHDGSYGAKEDAAADTEQADDEQPGEWKKPRRGKSKKEKKQESFNRMVVDFTERLKQNELAQTGAGSIGARGAA
eukprot:6690241-Heterocapsa_arctica.AAC.1